MNVSSINCQACNASLNLELSRNGIVTCEYCGTAHNLSRELTLKCDINNRQFAVVLCNTMIRNFNLQDLQNIVLNLSVKDNVLYHRLDWEDIGGGLVKSAKCRELVFWCQRHGVLQELVEVLITKRPLIIAELL